MRLRPVTFIWILLGLFILAFAVFRRPGSAVRDAGRSAAEVPPRLGPVPSFSFTERSGRAFGSADLKGRIWVADFIYTHCPSVCPMMTMRMARLSEKFRDAENLRFVSFTVDPRRDSPARLREYASIYTREKERWAFLTGDQKELYRVCVKGFKLTAMDRPASEVTPGEDELVHSDRFALVDGEGSLRGYYDATDPASLLTLEEDIRTLRSLPPAGKAQP